MQRARQQRHVARRRHLTRIRQAVGIDPVGTGHAEPRRGVVHQLGEALDRAAHAFGDGDRHVVGALDHDDLQRVVEGDLRTGAETHLGGRHARGALRHDHRRVEAHAPLAHRRQRDIGRHQLGDRGRIPVARRLARLQHVAGIEIDQQRGCRARRARADENRERGGGRGEGAKRAEAARRKRHHGRRRSFSRRRARRAQAKARRPREGPRTTRDALSYARSGREKRPHSS